MTTPILPADHSARRILKRARALIADPAHWTQRTLARDEKGVPMPFWDQRAVSWCMIGAVDKCGGLASGWIVEIAWQYVNSAIVEMGLTRNSVGQLNDTTDHATVLAVLDRAIALATGDES